jgi:hypothetical protein
MLDAADLPDDVAALKAMLTAAQAREAAKDVAIASKDEHIKSARMRLKLFTELIGDHPVDTYNGTDLQAYVELFNTGRAKATSVPKKHRPSASSSETVISI